jgi:hypothetical protein
MHPRKCLGFKVPFQALIVSAVLTAPSSTTCELADSDL